jgi:hypothetical protein
MPNSKLTTIITALMLLARTSSALAAYNLEQLREIERLVMSKDTAALGRYLTANPTIVEGDDPLAKELRGFRDCAQGGGLDCFASEKVVKQAIEEKEGTHQRAPTTY